MHALNIDQGTKEGIGEPGGPRDVVIVGAGPAGLQAAINGGTEGLDTLMVDQNAAPGGQIGLTSRTENVLGFPAGISGQEYAQDGLEQAQRVGAETKLGVGVTGMSYDPGTGLKTLTLSDGSTVDARSVIVAGGVQFNTLNFPGSEAKGIIYGDSGAVKDMSKGGDAVIVGGGNSAGQATVNVAETADSATLLVRGDSLKESMSPYLIDQLQSAPNVDIRYNSEIASATSEPGTHNLQSLTLKDGSTIPADALGVYIGSSPKTGWADIVDRDPHGFITTGGQGASSPLETNVPGVFAAGDVRAGSMHRVVGAAGEGGMALASAWQYVNNTDFGVKKAAAVRVMVYGARRLSPVPGDRFLAKMVNLDEQEPFTGFDPDASE